MVRGTSMARQTADAAILIVEDEQMLLDAVSRMLRKQGYTVVAAPDGDAAIDVLRRHGNPIALVILDVSLPGASSREVLLESRKHQPDTPVILTSAFDEIVFRSSFEGLQVDGFIQKPYRLAALVELIKTKVPVALTTDSCPAP